MQSRKWSLIESITNTTIGFIIAMVGNYVIMYLILGIPLTLQQNLWIGIFMTVLSIIRGYFLRRIFNYFQED